MKMSGLALQIQQPLVMTVPDALFPSNNQFDIPVLDASLQAEFVVLPWIKWGDIGRSKPMAGTYHFYTADYKFNALWAKPQTLINSGCAGVVEPNFSTNDHMPTAAGVWAIYRKRWMTRFWQHYGVRVFVDLNVSTKFAKINLLGVPRGWNAYATRVTSGTTATAMADYQIACKHAGRDNPLFLVYGGGRKTEAVCQQHGWVWLAENMYAKDGRLDDG